MTMEDASVWIGAMNNTVGALAEAAAEEAKRRLGSSRSEWTGIGLEWLRSLLGKREWRVPCVDIYVRL